MTDGEASKFINDFLLRKGLPSLSPHYAVTALVKAAHAKGLEDAGSLNIGEYLRTPAIDEVEKIVQIAVVRVDEADHIEACICHYALTSHGRTLQRFDNDSVNELHPGLWHDISAPLPPINTEA